MNFNPHWPSKRGNIHAPWYRILRRVVFMPVILVGIGVLWTGAALAHGLGPANAFVEDVI